MGKITVVFLAVFLVQLPAHAAIFISEQPRQDSLLGEAAGGNEILSGEVSVENEILSGGALAESIPSDPDALREFLINCQSQLARCEEVSEDDRIIINDFLKTLESNKMALEGFFQDKARESDVLLNLSSVLEKISKNQGVIKWQDCFYNVYAAESESEKKPALDASDAELCIITLRGTCKAVGRFNRQIKDNQWWELKLLVVSSRKEENIRRLGTFRGKLPRIKQ